MTEDALTGPIEVIGTGLLGTSVALAAKRAGLEVLLTDIDTDHVRTATALGAGRARVPEDTPQLVVVAVPPASIPLVVTHALSDSDAMVTDVGSFKGLIVKRLADHPDLSRYVGSHPMAGNERNGPLASSAALFEGRPWAITPHSTSSPEAVALVTALIELCGASLVTMSPGDHDKAVARTSHVPHLMAALTAGRLFDATEEQLSLAGQGVRDVTRVSGGEPRLYEQIISGNSDAVLELLTQVRSDLDSVIDELESGAPDQEALGAVLDRGQKGTKRIPGKHGGVSTPVAPLFVTVPDAPGSLAKLFADAAELSINIEDVRIDHDPARQVGVVELDVDATRLDEFARSLSGKNWVVHQ